MAKRTKGRKATKGKKDASAKPQQIKKHPDQWEHDLNPNRLGGQNIGGNPVQSDSRARTAADIKTLTERLSDFRMDELTEIPIVPAGTQLKQGAIYLDLREPSPVPFTATAQVAAGEHNYYTPKAEVPYELWNRLVEMLRPAPVANPTAPSEQAMPFSPEAAAVERRSAANDQTIREPAADGETVSESQIDEAVAQSFPASDPPSWTTGSRKETEPRETKNDDLDSLSDQELNDKARELDVQGRDSMNREQLILAIRGQLSGSEV
jgi:hypothetical protein